MKISKLWICKYIQNTVKIISPAFFKIFSWVLLALGFVLGMYAVQAFQVLSPSNSGNMGTGTTSSYNNSLGAPLLTKDGGVFDRNAMSLQAIAENTSGMYANKIIAATFPDAYDEVCFKSSAMYRDQHAAGESTTGGNCVPGDTGFVIEKVASAAVPWWAAKATCAARGMRLPEVFEWDLAMRCALAGTTSSAICGSTWSEMVFVAAESVWNAPVLYISSGTQLGHIILTPSLSNLSSVPGVSAGAIAHSQSNTALEMSYIYSYRCVR